MRYYHGKSRNQDWKSVLVQVIAVLVCVALLGVLLALTVVFAI